MTYTPGQSLAKCTACGKVATGLSTAQFITGQTPWACSPIADSRDKKCLLVVVEPSKA